MTKITLNRRKNLTLYSISVFLLLVFTVCQQERSSQIDKIVNDAQISDNKAISEVLDLLFKDRLKGYDIQEMESGHLLFVEYGGNTALTFLSGEKYEQNMKKDLALQMWEIYYFLKNRKISSIRMSLRKPYYVNKTDNIEEFEIFRAKIDQRELEKIISSEERPPLEMEVSEEEFAKLSPLLEEIEKHWQVELDLFSKIEISP